MSLSLLVLIFSFIAVLVAVAVAVVPMYCQGEDKMKMAESIIPTPKMTGINTLFVQVF